MPKQYYINKELREVAKITLDNYEKVNAWVKSKNLDFAINLVREDGKIYKLEFHTLTNPDSKFRRDLPIDIHNNGACYLLCKPEGGFAEILSQNEWDGISPQKAHYLMQYFKYRHLSGPAKGMSKRFADLATQIDLILPESPEKTMALRKLLESKDCSVRATFYQE